MNQAGTTLVEWVIALALNAFIAAAVLLTLQVSREAMDLSQQWVELADRGRFARAAIEQDLRQASAQLPCAVSPAHAIREVNVLNSAPGWLRLNAPVWGIEAPSTAPASRWRLKHPPVTMDGLSKRLPSDLEQHIDAQSDVLWVYRLHPQPSATVVPVSNTDFRLTRSADQRPCGIWWVSDCNQTMIFQDTEARSRLLSARGLSCAPGNQAQPPPMADLAWPMTEHMAVYLWEATAWFVGHNQEDQRVLYRARLGQGGDRVRVDEMVRGVLSLQVEYGQSNAGAHPKWTSAASVDNWSNVDLVRFGLVVTAPSQTARPGLDHSFVVSVLSSNITVPSAVGLARGFDGAAQVTHPGLNR